MKYLLIFIACYTFSCAYASVIKNNSDDLFDELKTKVNLTPGSVDEIRKAIKQRKVQKVALTLACDNSSTSKGLQCFLVKANEAK